jgi:hypothetical protein
LSKLSKYQARKTHKRISNFILIRTRSKSHNKVGIAFIKKSEGVWGTKINAK